MGHPYHHALSSVKKFKGKPEDYIKIHDFFDSTKKCYATWKHRALLHNSFGIYLAEQIFGTTIKNSDGKEIPVRLIGEQHVKEDLGFIPSVQDWLANVSHKSWMTKGVEKLDVE